ncbi:hypothetical protein [Acinetobacter nosocomialis]|uniref:hypothetical protein n=1 Tax=Acinetobacter nosocomialis TaxID=106654 RepID=UPI002578128D|nr:hypothetical protein [Acinetobacter nosocomialis]WJI02847.1 hypothetical protein MW889_20070 [Acinetobacter nosocomialis]
MNLTADPETSKNKAVELGHPVINITAKPEYMGNGAIRNPERGLSFMQDIHALFHSLTDKGITKFMSYHVHPMLLVYGLDKHLICIILKWLFMIT